MKRYLQIAIRVSSSAESDILMASLSDFQFYAFEQEDHTLIAYINEEDIDEKMLDEIINPKNIISTTLIEEENWNQLWESDFKPVTIDDFAIIRAPFHEFPGGVKHDLVITPKMSFGTGHHATTWQMISLMGSLLFQDKKVLDFGTGTGVLAILSEKCGAAQVLAIDLDEWSIQNTLENIQTNQCGKIEVAQRDNLKDLENYDIILANINLNVLTASATSLSAIQDSGSHLLTSGFLKKDVAIMETTFSSLGYKLKKQSEKDYWTCILFEKK